MIRLQFSTVSKLKWNTSTKQDNVVQLVDIILSTITNPSFLLVLSPFFFFFFFYLYTTTVAIHFHFQAEPKVVTFFIKFELLGGSMES